MFLMPLYIHAMPSHVMAFIERLPASGGSISFFVQSGFPESSQSHYLEAYFELLARGLGRTYLGTAIKGGVDGLRMRPPKAQEGMMAPMVKAVEFLVEQGAFHPDHLRRLALPVQFGKGIQWLLKLMVKAGPVNDSWVRQLKENQAFDRRDDRPYLLDAVEKGTH